MLSGSFVWVFGYGFFLCVWIMVLCLLTLGDLLIVMFVVVV